MPGNVRTKIIYLDYAATNPVDPQVVKGMQPYWSEKFGNPSSVYSLGRESKKAIDQSRTTIAKILNCHSDHIFFTAGGTESINTAIFGVVRAWKKRNSKKKPHIISTTIEHSAVLNSIRSLEEDGVEATYIKPDTSGIIKPGDILSAIKDNTALISVMYANNEVGSIQDIASISKQLKKVNSLRIQHKLPVIAFHSDGCQGAGTLEIDVQALGVDLFSLNASKIYGPKQVGCLYVRSGINLEPILSGGGQEKGLRSGTENVPGIVGFAYALDLAQKKRVQENNRLRKLRNYLIAQIEKRIEGVEVNGPHFSLDTEKNPVRLPNNVNISFLGVEGEALMLYLDSYGICVSTGSACDSTQTEPSHVIQALGKPSEIAASSIRMSLGKATTKSDLDYVVKVIEKLVIDLRKVTQS